MKGKLLDIWENLKVQKFIEGNKDIVLKVAAAAVLVVAAFFVFIFSGPEEESLAEEKEIIAETETKVAMIMVDIGGEVNTPMVAELKEGSRVEDAIKAAGGVTEKADLTDINRAAFLEDGDKILIPSKETNTDDGAGGTTVSYSDGKININTATSEQLQLLNGIGPATAEKIIQYRQDNGRFDTIEDIKNVSGIGEKTFEKFMNDIKT